MVIDACVDGSIVSIQASCAALKTNMAIAKCSLHERSFPLATTFKRCSPSVQLNVVVGCNAIDNIQAGQLK